MLSGNPGHLRAFDYTGLHRYFLTFCTDRRRRLFLTPEVVGLVRSQIERVLRDDEATLIVARYIVENPVRAGLTTNPESYPFSGSQVYSLRDILAAVGEIVSFSRSG